MRAILLCLLCFGELALLAAPAPLPRLVKGDLQQFQGEWTVTDADSKETVTLTVFGNRIKLRMESDSGKTESEAEIALEPGAVPKGLVVRDITYRTTESPTRRIEGQLVGIYRLLGETLTLCLAHESNERPSDFTRESGHLLTLTRAKR